VLVWLVWLVWLVCIGLPASNRLGVCNQERYRLPSLRDLLNTTGNTHRYFTLLCLHVQQLFLPLGVLFFVQ
jgi:hypothetical protein